MGQTPSAAVLARICAAAWGRAPGTEARLKRAGFAPGHWPDWDGLAAIAVLDKSALAARQLAAPPLGGLDAAPPGALFLSTGGTMEPDLPEAEQRLADFMQASGLAAGDVVLNGFSYHLTPAGLLFHAALRRLGCRVLPVGPQNTDAALELAQRAGATGFVGITGHLAHLLARAAESGITLKLRLAFAGGEPFGGPIRAELAARHGIVCHDFYGTADVGIVAGGAGADGLPLFRDVVAEILDPETSQRLPDGETGQLVLSVANAGYPVLRLGTGDLAALMPGPPPRLLGPFGRVDASARVRGLLLHEPAMRAALAAHPAIRAGWAEITRDRGRDEITVLLDLAPNSDRAAAEAAFRARFLALCRLTPDHVAPAPPNGVAGPVIRDRRRETAA